jgi:hypothetical protein
MQRRVVLLLALVGLCCSPTESRADPASGGEGAPKRRKVSCQEVAANTPEFTPGSWGAVPPELQKVPPGSELCGSSNVGLPGQVFFASPLFGKSLEAFYVPLFAKAGCKMTCKVKNQQTSCTCDRVFKYTAIVTSTGNQSFCLTTMK